MRESERIRSVAAHYGSQGKLAKMLGTTQSNVANWIQRGTLTSSAIKMFAEKCPEISLEWLTRGQGVMLVGADMIDTPGRVDFAAKRRGGIRVVPTGKAKRRFGFADIGCMPYLRALRLKGGEGYPVVAAVQSTGKILQDVFNEQEEPKKVARKKAQSSKTSEEIGKRKQNEILKESLAKVASEIRVEDGKLEFTPYIMKEDGGIAVLPVQKKSEAYFQVKGISMSPSINEGDVVGVVSTDWFEVFSPNNIYLLILLSGELMIRRIVQPENHSDDYITVKSDNPEEPEMQIQRRQIADIKRVCYVGKNL